MYLRNCEQFTAQLPLSPCLLAMEGGFVAEKGREPFCQTEAVQRQLFQERDAILGHLLAVLLKVATGTI